MKLNKKQNNVETSDISNVSNFQIKASAKAFSILSSGLYSDKITAIIRELSCNAYDSHVAANKKDVPFSIELPNDLSDVFAVEDFGTGLSHEQILNLYQTYFSSTKTDSNDYVGALGLGSKSPFSYTDQFSVRSRYNGKEYNYIAFIDEAGLPSITLVGESKTEECNGIKVYFSVKKEDFYSFKKSCANVIYFFDIIPACSIEEAVVEQKKYMTDVDDYVVFERHKAPRFLNNAIGAIQGNILYPINIPSNNHIKSEFSKEELDAIDIVIDSDKVALKFNIGELDVTASREEISYDDSTIRNLYNKILKVYKDVEQKILEEYGSLSCEWDKQLFIRSNRHSNIYRSVFREHTIEGKKFNFRRKLLRDYKVFSVSSSYSSIRPKMNRLSIWSDSFYPHKEHTIIINDIGSKYSQKDLLFYLRENYLYSYEKVYIITSNIKNVDRLKNYLTATLGGFDNFVLMSSIPKIKKEKRVYEKSDDIMRYCKYGEKIKDKWKSVCEEVDIKYYVDLKGYKAKYKDSEIDVNSILDTLVNFGILSKEDNIYGVRRNSESTLSEDSKNIYELFTSLRENKEFLRKALCSIIYEDRVIYDAFEYASYWREDKTRIDNFLDNLNKGNILYRYLKIVKKAKGKRSLNLEMDDTTIERVKKSREYKYFSHLKDIVKEKYNFLEDFSSCGKDDIQSKIDNICRLINLEEK